MLFLSTLPDTGGTYTSGDNEGKFYLSLPPDRVFNRGRLVEAMDRLGCRLKILLTDACRYSVDVQAIYVNARPEDDFYKHLFFQHKGLSECRCSESGEYAVSNPQLVGCLQQHLLK